MHGHIAYLVKFLGNTDVEHPKGIEVVKEGIRKLRFSQQLRKAEGQRTPKVELTVSVDGVAIQEPKGKRILHQYPLHRISYCADDKAEKKFFSFIAKEEDSEKHTCYVFVSDKLAEEITLTIGQAFDLAYRRFLESSGREVEGRRQVSQLQEKLDNLERQNQVLRRRLLELSNLVDNNKMAGFLESEGVSNVLDVALDSENVSSLNGSTTTTNRSTNGGKQDETLINFHTNDRPNTVPQINNQYPNLPPVPPRSFEAKGVKSDIAMGDFVESDDDFDPRGSDTTIMNNNARNATINVPLGFLSTLQPKIEKKNGKSPHEKDIFGAEPFGENSTDPFGMADFGRVVSQTDQEINFNTGVLNRRMTEMQEGFTRGISFEGDDFNLESLDPLRL